MNFLVFIAIAILILAFFLKSKERFLIGWVGEKFVSLKFRGLNPQHYKILNNLLLPSHGNLTSTQIDHIIVSNHGIFCIETKAYKGWIFGSANQAYWTQVIYRYKKRFYNPLRQNYAHVKAVEELIKSQYPKVQIFSLVAFPYAEKLKISGTDMVGYTYEIVNKIKSFTAPIFTNLQRDEICDILTNANICDKKKRKLHIKGVRDLKRY